MYYRLRFKVGGLVKLVNSEKYDKMNRNDQYFYDPVIIKQTLSEKQVSNLTSMKKVINLNKIIRQEFQD